jgi:hypothetical protein
VAYFMFLGLKRNSLTVVKNEGKDYRGKRLWRCLCICGNETILETNSIMSERKPTRTCGKCEWHIKHKDAYISWMAMKQRCDDPSRKDYKYYGGRGITYNIRWVEFVNFFIDMGDPPCSSVTGERLSLDRIDVNANYYKENCCWSTRSEQQLNKTTS